MGFDVARWVIRKLNRGDDAIMDRALDVRLLPARGPASWWADRLRLLATVTLTATRRRFAPSPPLRSEIVAYDVATSSGYREHRSYFVRHHFGEPLDFVGRGEERVPGTGRGPWLRWYALGIAAALLALTDVSDRRYRWIGWLLLDVQSMARALPGITKVYVFGLYDRRSYLLTTFLAKHSRVEVIPVFQNIPLYRNCRFFHLDIPVVLTSRVNIPEVEFFREQGIFKSAESVYRSGEYVSDTIDLAPTAPTCDIGYFSSGEWARIGGLYISRDIEAIRRGDLADNAYAATSQMLIEALARYARENGRTLRLYPHPMERGLWEEHGIEPPYVALADGARVTVDRTGSNSRSKTFEPRVAVSLQSSFIWERLDLGLDSSFIYAFADPELNIFDRDSLGPFIANVFDSPQEMVRMVDEALRGASGGAIS
ncbi:MAG: hypothetical protein Q7W30_01775 [Coriobacteriia bacterium]|nr:hypothetical protein [Coriobacteriia bacterium]